MSYFAVLKPYADETGKGSGPSQIENGIASI